MCVCVLWGGGGGGRGGGEGEGVNNVAFFLSRGDYGERFDE